MYLGFYCWWVLYILCWNVAILAYSSQTGIDVILVMCLRECAGLRGCNSSVCLNPSVLGTRISWGSSLQRLTEYKRWNAKYIVNAHCAVYLQTFIHNHVVIALFYIPRLASYPGYFLSHASYKEMGLGTRLIPRPIFNAGSHIGQPGMKLMLYTTNQAFTTESIERTCLCEGNLVLSVLRLTFIERVAYIP